MTEQELIADINDEITFSGALPYGLPEKEVKRIILNDSRYFWDNWRHAVESRYLLLPLELFQNSTFKKFRQIQLPDCVQFVVDFKEAKGGSIFATIDRDFAEQKFIGSEIFLTPFIGESIMYRTVMFSFLDLTKAMMLDTIAYDYNKNSKLLGVIGRTPKTNAVIRVFKKLDQDKLFEDEMFQRYVRAHAKVRLSHMLQTFNYTLPGGVTVNYQNIVTTAEKEMEAVNTMMKGENTPDWMYLTRQ
ncbi:hypothetical protein UFOVP699_241 [uncultured Caudovirales phage]|uniref:Neck protein n=1 Tax=uncultured Caudovirales phage TaxID=2100421 RepID=A0A6J5NQS0_9CAUD|nr:hypothetical protein UFOVP699_241 [uncultured Caudovirales phage]